jgi:uncharacterized protein (TIGR02466 family)
MNRHIHCVFPSLIYHSSLNLSVVARKNIVSYLLSRYVRETKIDHGRLTSDMTENTLHHDDSIEVRTLMKSIADSISDFLYQDLSVRSIDSQFFIGRCWPVIQAAGGAGELHIHHGATLSGAAYLDMPDGAGGVEFVRSNPCALDCLPKRAITELNTPSVTILPENGDLLLFDASLRHRALRSHDSQVGLRLAVGFDIFSTCAGSFPVGGLPHLAFLRSIEGFAKGNVDRLE